MHDVLRVPTRNGSDVNDFALKLANVNGTGSASANGLLMQAIFRMGIPVTGKNLFPSNIQGLPTWYEIRVNKDGYGARALDYDLMVAMNSQTYERDVREVRSGGFLMYDSSWPLDPTLHRDDVTFLGVPLAKMCNETFGNPRERILMKNIAYAGSLCAALDIDMGVVAELLKEKFGKKKALLDSNDKALKLGYDYARDHFSCPLPFRLEKMEANGDKILIDGNTATALGCLYAGATVAAWYPITPATSVMDAFKMFCEEYRKDPDTGKNNFIILQAEDELAAIGMVLGASWNGARAFTSTAGPGVSLMNELLGLAYYAEIPAVVIDVQRVGPSTGMPTRTQQGDILECAYASHGDTRHILLFPANPAECFEFAVKSFDLAERFQTPVMMLSDLDIGMNDWVIPRLKWNDGFQPDRGRILSAEDLEKAAKYFRYSPLDENHVAARTLPGVDAKGSYFTRGSGHNKLGGYTENPDEYQEVMDRLKLKHKAAAKFVPAPIIHKRQAANGEPARFGVLSLGGCDPAVREALDILTARGIPADYLRVCGFPFADSVEEFLNSHEFTFVIEQNRDAQLKALLTLETAVAKDKMRSVLIYGGFPLSARHVVDEILKHDDILKPITMETGELTMPSIAKPIAKHPSLKRNDLGLTIRDYEGSMSTLCAGCGHDSITAAITRAFWELSTPPHMIGKLSGIGCSSKTPTYFVGGAHGFNSAHGRMPAIATGAAAANRDLTYIGISGDGDSLSIGLGQLCHAIRRNVRMLYVIENNGVYGLTKGQFSASADIGTKSKRGEQNRMGPIDPVRLGLTMGASFIARSFSGDKEQLVPILKAAVGHRGFALVDVISPCVTFNDHEGSTKSYLATRKHMVRATETDFVPPETEILAHIGPTGSTTVTMHDGSVVRFTRTPPDYDPTDRAKVTEFLDSRAGTGEVLTGLLYVDGSNADMHELSNSTEVPMAHLPYEALCPGSAVLEKLQDEYR